MTQEPRKKKERDENRVEERKRKEERGGQYDFGRQKFWIFSLLVATIHGSALREKEWRGEMREERRKRERGGERGE